MTGRRMMNVVFDVTTLAGTLVYKIELEQVTVAAIRTEASNAFGEGVPFQGFRIRGTGYSVGPEGTVTGTSETRCDCGKNAVK